MHRIWKSILGIGLGAGLLAGICVPASADVLHFYNGKTLQGKVSRVTGDIIEFKPDWFNSQFIERITLTNRRDIVETRTGKKYFGEIIYIDKFQVELQTAAGRTKLNRLLVKSIVVGSPLQAPMNDLVENMPSAAKTNTTVRVQPATKPAKPEPGFQNVNLTSSAPAAKSQSPEKPLVQFPDDLDSGSMRPANEPSMRRIDPNEDFDAIPAPEDRMP